MKAIPVKKRIEVSKTFWGEEVVGSNILLDPTGMFFSYLEINNQLINVTRGWFRKGVVNISEDKVFNKWTILTCMQGVQIADCIRVLVDKNRHMMLLGFAGGINNVDIGDIVLCDTVLSRNLSESYTLSTDDKIQNEICRGTVASTDSMLSETEELVLSLTESGVVAVDLESFTFAMHTNNNVASNGVVLLITDRPQDKPFYTNPLSSDGYRMGIHKVINLPTK
jgi:hypothetical protein